MGIIPDKFRVVDYYHIDDMRCFRPLCEAVAKDPGGMSRLPELQEELERIFLKAGWEGDGEIRCLFVPPCFYNASGSTDCAVIYHVKQRNNGTSWLALPVGLLLALPENYRAPCYPIIEARTSGIAVMRRWFFSHYKNPADETPWSGGGYSFLYGGPYDARQVLFGEFNGQYSPDEIEALACELDRQSPEWAPAEPENLEDFDWPDEDGSEDPEE